MVSPGNDSEANSSDQAQNAPGSGSKGDGRPVDGYPDVGGSERQLDQQAQADEDGGKTMDGSGKPSGSGENPSGKSGKPSGSGENPGGKMKGRLFLFDKRVQRTLLVLLGGWIALAFLLNWRFFRLTFLAPFSSAHTWSYIHAGGGYWYTTKEPPRFVVSADGGNSFRYRVFRGDSVPASYRDKSVNYLEDRPPNSDNYFGFNDYAVANLSPSLEGTEPFITRDVGSCNQLLELPPMEPGDYYLVVDTKKGKDSVSSGTWFRVTDIGLITKYDGEKAVVQAVDLNTRKPCNGVNVRLFHRYSYSSGSGNERLEYKKLAASTTNSDGLAIMQREGYVGSEDWSNLIIAADCGKNRASDSICSFGDYNERQTISEAFGPELREPEYRSFLTTDRPIYRLGQRVFYKAIVRQFSVKGLSNPGNVGLTVEVRDPDNKLIVNNPTVTDKAGTLSGYFDIAAAGSTGVYSVSLTYPDTTQANFSVNVEQYRRPEYVVSVTPAAPYTVAGSKMKFKVKANYYFGTPVVNAAVHYTVTDYLDQGMRNQFRHNTESSDDMLQYGTVNEYIPGDRQAINALSLSGTVQTDNKGEAVIEFGTPRERLSTSSPLDYSGWEKGVSVSVAVTDVSRKTVESSGQGTLTSGDFLVLVTPQIRTTRGGQNLPVKVETLSYDKKPLADKAISLELCKWTLDNGHKWKREIIATQAVRTGEDGNGEAILSLPEKLTAGVYHVVAKGLDEGGRDVVDVSTVWVQGDLDTGIASETQPPLSLQFDRSEYAPGQIASVLVRAPLAQDEESELLVSVEGYRIHEVRRVHLRGPSKMLQVPIKEAYWPQLSVSLAYVGALHQPYVAARSVKISPRGQTLQVKITPNKQSYSPGERARYKISVTDWTKHPVPGADLALSVADESVYDLAPSADPAKELADALFADCGAPQVFTRFSFIATAEEQLPDDGPWFDTDRFLACFNPLGILFRNDREYEMCKQASAPQSAPSLQGATNGTIGPESASDLAASPPVRQTAKFVRPRSRTLFKELAAWIPHVTTNTQGIANVTVALPDDLTTWRATAFGVAGTRAGVGINSVVSQQPVMARLSMPRFFTEGDRGCISAIVHNYSSNVETIKLTLSASKQLSVDGPLTKIIIVGKNAVSRFTWPVHVVGAGEAQVKLTAAGTHYGDELLENLPLRSFGYRAFFVKNGVLKDQSVTKKFPVVLPPDAKLDTGSFSLSLAPSTIGPVLGNFGTLIDYPYGCTEQTMSRLEPSIVAMNLHKQVGAGLSEADSQRFQTVYNLAITKLYDYQHSDGGWGWWKEDRSNPYLTAKVLEGFYRLKQVGFGIDSTRIEQALPYLAAQSEALFSTNWDRDGAIDHAYIEYVLSLYGRRPSAGMTAWHMMKINNMSPEELSYLVLALNKLGEKNLAQTAYQRLLSLRNDSDDYTDWDHTTGLMRKIGLETFDWGYTYRFTGIESTALALRAVAAMEPTSDLLERTTRWILLHHNESGWDNTKCTSEVFQALLEKELAQHRNGSTDFTASVFADGKLLSEFEFKALCEGCEKSVQVGLKPTEAVGEKAKSGAESVQSAASVAHTTYGTSNVFKNFSVARTPKDIVLSKKGPGWLYYTSVLEYDRPLHADGQLYGKCKPSDLKIERSFFRLVPDHTGDGLRYELKPLGREPLARGELVLMSVKVHSPVQVPYVMVEAPLPSGAEVVPDVSLSPVKSGQANPLESDSSWTHQDVLDDRIVLFASELANGDLGSHWTLRMEMPGVLNINPVSLQAMYTNQVRGYSTASGLNVKE